ncbi:MAG: hypothetical protein N4A31_06555 [Rickettsiales bacterium]|jgi:hypothetical protein|nr:hypothetical protein [Rickettsiales bacterium]
MTNLLELTTSNLDLGQILTKSAEIAANHVSGAALGGFLFSIPGAIYGAKRMIDDLDLKREPKTPSEALAKAFKVVVFVPSLVPMGAAMGAAIAAAPGALIGGALGGERSINLLATPFKAIIEASSYLAEPTQSFAKQAIGTTYSGITSHPAALAVASTALITGGMAYGLYNNYAQEAKYSSKILAPSLKEQEHILDDNFRALQNSLSTNSSMNKELNQANNKLLKEYYEKKEINLETVLKLQEVYKKTMQHLPQDKLEEMSELSIKLLENIGKCQELRQNHSLKEKESFAEREQNKKNSKQIRQH